MATLSSLLVQRGVASMRGVEDAIARQVISGGDLATNVLEVGAAREDGVTHLAAESAGLVATSVGRLQPNDPAVLRLLPRDVAARYGIFPIEKRGGDLVVATAEPLSQHVEDDLGFLLNLNLRPVYALRVRIAQALSDHYGHPLDRRFSRLLAKLEGRKPLPETEPPPRPDSVPPRPASVPPPPAAVPRPPSVPPPAAVPSSASPVETAPRRPSTPPPDHAASQPSAAPTPLVSSIETRPVIVTPMRPTLRGLPRVTPEAADAILSSGALSTLPSTLELSPLPPAQEPTPAALPPEPQALVAPLAAPAPPPPALTALARSPDERSRPEVRRAARARRKGPLSAGLAEEEMQSAVTTDGVLEVLFDFAQQYFDYCALFVVHGDVAEGRDSAGRGADRDRVRAIGLPLDLPSTLAAARDRRTTVLAELDSTGLDAELLRDLGRAPASELPVPTAPTHRGASIVIPVVVRDRAVALLFGDDSPASVELAAIGEVIAFAALAGASIERIIVRKKMARPDAAKVSSVAATSVSKTTQRPAPKPKTPAPPAATPPPAVARAGVAALARMFASNAPAPPPAASSQQPTSSGYPLSGRAGTLAAAVVDALVTPRTLSKPAQVPPNEPGDEAAAAPAPDASIPAVDAAPPADVSAEPPVGHAAPAPFVETPSHDNSIAVAVQTPSWGTGNVYTTEGAPAGGVYTSESALAGNVYTDESAPVGESVHNISQPQPADAVTFPEAHPEEPPAAPADLESSGDALTIAISVGESTPLPTDLRAHAEAIAFPEAPESDPSASGRPFVETPSPRAYETPAEDAPLVDHLLKTATPAEVAVHDELPPTLDASEISSAETNVIAPTSAVPWSAEDSRAPVVLDVFADSTDGLSSAIARAADAARERDLRIAQRAAQREPAQPELEAQASPDQDDETRAIAPHAPPPDETLTEGFPGVGAEPAHLSPDIPTAAPFATPPPAEAAPALTAVPLDALLAKALRGPTAPEARAELQRRAERNLAPLLAAFPGPLESDRHRGADRLLPASQCGPLLQTFALAGARGAATVAVLARHDDVDVRFWAAHLLGEIPSAEAADGLVAFLVDPDPAVRRIALRSAGAVVSAALSARPLENALAYLAKDPHTPLRERLAAVEAMGHLRASALVPALVSLLAAIPEEVAEASRRALLIVARQDFGRDIPRWNDWWSKNEQRHRIEWLIDALMHDTQSIRRAAGDELKQLTKEYFGYYDDLPKRERERAQERYREWWESEGRGRFR
ncbi:MAG: HEAT repeat domain-containing protein [Polyangiaceae bacterium]|nr:HEAT repeat domain-containing protein [Polyangiaceae bacterium]